MATIQPRALLFDVFGTVVDWRGTVIREGEALARARGFTVDWPRFADEWRREGYIESLARVRRGEEPWQRVDALHRRKLDDLIQRHNLTGLTEGEIAGFNRVWHRLDPWPDSVAGLTRLRQRHLIAPLSNGDLALLTNMARHASLPWDCILCAEIFRRYKPDPAVYQGAVALLDLRPDEVMMVAAHVGDLAAAQAQGLQTAFVPRPLEHGPDGPQERTDQLALDIVATDFNDLARQLNC